MSWTQLKADIFERMKERREKYLIFQPEHIYSLIVDSSQLFNKPGTRDAKNAQDRIQNTGSFLMVADSFRDFLALFPTDKAQAEPEQEPEPQQRAHATTSAVQTSVNARRSSGTPFRRNENPAASE